MAVRPGMKLLRYLTLVPKSSESTVWCAVCHERLPEGKLARRFLKEDLHACKSNVADTKRHLTVVYCCTERMGLCSYQFRCRLHRRAGQSGAR